MKILVVEDDSVTRLHLAYLVTALGYEVIAVANAAEAWPCLSDADIRIVLADWWMPGIDGPALCRRIRQRGGPYLYFILVTNQADSAENFAITSKAGVDDTMTKPVRPDELRQRLTAAVKSLGLPDESKPVRRSG